MTLDFIISRDRDERVDGQLRGVRLGADNWCWDVEHGTYGAKTLDAAHVVWSRTAYPPQAA